MPKLPLFITNHSKAFAIAATIAASLVTAVILIYITRLPPPPANFASCTTPAGNPLTHSEITFGTCGSDICQSHLSRPVYRCDDGAVLSTCIPDETCRDQPDYRHPYGRIPIQAGQTCPEEALFGCDCSTGPGKDDNIIANPSHPCPYRYCHSLSQIDRSCVRETYYYSNTCPQELLLFDTESDCTAFNASLSDADFAALSEAARFGKFQQRQSSTIGTGPGSSGSSGNSAASGDSGSTAPPDSQTVTSNYPGSTLSNLLHQIVGILPTKYFPEAIATLVEPQPDGPLQIGVDPDNPNYITITSPQSGATLRGVVPLTGGTAHPDFTYYFIEYAPDPNTRNVWTPITQHLTTPIFDDVLTTWDTTKLQNGTYQLRLAVSLQKNHFHFRYITVNNLHISN